MKKCMVVLTSGVTIEFKEGDVVHVGEIRATEAKEIAIQDLPLFLMTDGIKYISHHTKDKDKDVVVDYYLPVEKISWCYVQEVIDNEKN